MPLALKPLVPKDKRFVRSLRFREFLSFGPESPGLNLRPLNVLVGPNGVGKSNLLEGIDLLRSTPMDLRNYVNLAGGAADLIWSGSGAAGSASLDLAVNLQDAMVRHHIEISSVQSTFRIEDEFVDTAREAGDRKISTLYDFRRGKPEIKLAGSGKRSRPAQSLSLQEHNPTASVLSQRKDSIQYPELTALNSKYSSVKRYRVWSTGISALKRPTDASKPSDCLSESFDNLSLVVNDLDHRQDGMRTINEMMKRCVGGFERLSVKVEPGGARLFLHDKLVRAIPSSRLSDGTLYFLSLCVVLCHPKPPPLICLEEPELGLHPDMMHVLAEMLIEASSRTQVLVTTHSDALVDALTDTPEAIIVCEKDEKGSTVFRRLNAKLLENWLKDYSLGNLWRSGKIGGNRW